MMNVSLYFNHTAALHALKHTFGQQKLKAAEAERHHICAGVWFVVHHFWFLDVELDGMSLQRLCQLLLAAMVPAVLLPGLVASRVSSSLISALLVVQARF